MSLVPGQGHILNVGDRVRISIPAVQAEMEEFGSDGIEITSSGKNYWRYINEHPDEVYTIIGLDFNYDDPYILSGYMDDTTWGAACLIHLPEPESNFEVIKNMTIEEMAEQLFPLLAGICEDGVPSKELMLEWLEQKPEDPRRYVETEGGERNG